MSGLHGTAITGDFLRQNQQQGGHATVIREVCAVHGGMQNGANGDSFPWIVFCIEDSAEVVRTSGAENGKRQHQQCR